MLRERLAQFSELIVNFPNEEILISFIEFLHDCANDPTITTAQKIKHLCNARRLENALSRGVLTVRITQ